MGKSLAIELERKVIIENNKLGACQILLQLIVVLAIGNTLWNSRAWRSTTTPLGSMAYWIEANDYESQVAIDKASPICTDSAEYNYDDGAYVYDNFECRELDPVERYLKTADTCYIRTLIEETFVGVLKAPAGTGTCAEACDATYSPSDCSALHPAFDGTVKPSGEKGKTNAFGDCLCECIIETDFFPLGVEGLTIALVPKASADELAIDGSRTFTDVSYTQMNTALMGTDGMPMKWFAPGETVKLPLKDLLEITGVDLDATKHSSTAKNVFPAPASEYPSARVTGMEITLSISYHNKDDRKNLHSDQYDYVAYITAKPQVKWNSQQRMDYGATPPGPDGTGLRRSHYMYNISITFLHYGSYSYTDLGAMVAMLGIIGIYLQIPNKIMGFICEYCLGNLSALYRSGIRQPISAEKVYAGMMARGIIASAVFNHLIMPKDDENGGSGFGKDSEPTITSKRLEQLILDMLKSGGRIDNMEDAAKCRSLLAIEMDGNTRRKFIDVALNSDLTTLRSVADNFDSDRTKIPIGEKLFKEQPRRKTAIAIPDFDFD
jgi:hypothetical protein